MTLCTADFETGVDGNNIQTADAGSATAWDVVQRSGSSTIVYDNQFAQGTLSGKLTNVAGAACWLEWAAAIGTPTDWYGRMYMYITSIPPANTPLFLQCLDGGSVAFRLNLNASTGIIIVVYNTGSNNMAVPVATNQWVRIEWHVIHSATVGQVEVKLFNNASSSTPSETFTSTANKNTLTKTDQIRLGQITAFETGQDVWLDYIVAGATSYPGPVAVPLVPGYQRLYGPAQLATSAATLYTVPDGTIVRLRKIYANNPSGSPVDFTFSIGADAAATRLYDSYNVPAGGSLEWAYDHALVAGETIQAYAGTASTLVLVVDAYVEPVG